MFPENQPFLWFFILSFAKAKYLILPTILPYFYHQKYLPVVREPYYVSIYFVTGVCRKGCCSSIKRDARDNRVKGDTVFWPRFHSNLKDTSTKKLEPYILLQCLKSDGTYCNSPIHYETAAFDKINCNCNQYICPSCAGIQLIIHCNLLQLSAFITILLITSSTF